MKKALLRDTFIEIKTTMGRFVALFSIVALGVGFFAGLNGTPADMKMTADSYFDEQNLMDLRLLSTLGFTEDDAGALRAQAGIRAVMPTYSADALVQTGAGDQPVRFHALPDLPAGDPANINRPVLVEGRLPEKAGECAIDENMTAAISGDSLFNGEAFGIGGTVRLSGKNSGETRDMLPGGAYTVVGVVRSPYYISFQRGSTDIGNGKVTGYVMLSEADFHSDYYTEVFATVDGAAALPCFSDGYKTLVSDETDSLEPFADGRADLRYAEVKEDAQAEIDEAQAELDDARAEYGGKKKDASGELADAKQKIDDGEKEVKDGEKKLEDSERKLNEGEAEYEKNYNAFDDMVGAAQGRIDAGRAQLAPQKKAYEDAKAALDAGYARVAELRAAADAMEAAGDIAGAAALRATADGLRAQLDAQKPAVDAAGAQVAAAEGELNSAQYQLDAQKGEAWGQLADARAQLDDGWAQLAQGKQDLADARKDLDDGRREYEDAKKETDEKLADAQGEIDDAQAKIDDAQAELDELADAKWYILNRDTNPGYAGYGADADRVAAISAVFPFFFFLVAALVCLTTMTRMVEEQRTQIGVLKAMGYGKGAVIAKYVAYAAMASVAGSAIGLLVGFWVFPTVIAGAYGIMYTLPPVQTLFQADYALAASGMAVASTLLATLWACASELVSVPAELIRPKAPPPGKRVFLEKIPAVWKRLRFSQKVTVRNLFRYKKRFVMTVVGIAGCAALMLTGFGLRDSIANIVSHQFEAIHTYDVMISVEKPSDAEAKTPANEGFGELLAESVYITQPSVTAEANGAQLDGYLMVPEHPEQLNDFVAFRDRVSGEAVAFPQPGEVVVTEKLANELRLSPGDTFTVKKGDTDTAAATVGGVTENYIYNYVYMAPADYRAAFGDMPEYKEALGKTAADLTDAQQAALSEQLLELPGVESATFVSKISDDFSDVMKSLDSVVWLLIVCANLLAFIVLYNLVNINVTERLREIATIKVLGFYDGEVSAYVYRENMILTAIGVVFGLVGGVFLHQFVVRTAEVDIVMFERAIQPVSYVFAAALTFLFAAAVNFIMHFKLKKISMVESLKSTE